MDFAEAGQRAGAHPPDIVGDLVEGDGDAPQRARHLDEPIAVRLSLKVVNARTQFLNTGQFYQLSGDFVAEIFGGVQPGSDGRTTDGELTDARQRGLHALDASFDLPSVARELLPQGHRYRIHQVGASGLHNLFPLGRLGRQRLVQRRQ